MRAALAAAACLLAPCASAQERPAPTRPFLTLNAAQAGVEACLAYARDAELRVAVAVMDRGGRLVALARMDDVFVKQVEFAQVKAETASTTPASSKRIAEITTPGGPLESLILLPGVTGVEGGEPVRLRSGYAAGGVGVSGASPAQDGVCARRAVEAIKAELEG